MLNDPTFWYAVSFALFIGLLGRPLFKIITAALQNTQQSIQHQLLEAQELREKAQRLLHEANTCRNEARQEAREILEHAEKEALRTQEQALAEVNKFFVTQEQELHECLKQLQYEAKETLKKQLCDLTLAATVKNFQENYSAAIDQKVLQNTVRDMPL